MIVQLETWDPAYKGIDDLLAAGEQPTVTTYVPPIWSDTNWCQIFCDEQPTVTTYVPPMAMTTTSSAPATQHVAPPTIRQLIASYPELRPPVIHGLLRRAETAGIISAPKLRKSWFIGQLALKCTTGGYWHNFLVERGNVLIVDNELHPETSAYRIPKIAEAMNLSISDYGDSLFVENLRGKLTTLSGLHHFFKQFKPRDFNLIILDAWYRFMPEGHDENSNSANVYNLLDNYAAELDCAIAYVHHTSKGTQSAKSVTDVGAGGGVQSRAVDAHIILRQHSQSDVVVFDAVLRSFPEIQPFCLRWDFPLWQVDEHIDPAALKDAKPAKAAGDKPTRHQAIRQRVIELLAIEPRTKTKLKELLGVNGTTIKEVVDSLLEDGEAATTKIQTKAGEFDGYKLANSYPQDNVGQTPDSPGWSG